MNDIVRQPWIRTREECIKIAQDVLDEDPLFLDSATSDLQYWEGHELVEITIADKTGRILFESLVRPRVNIDYLGRDYRGGLRNEDLKDAPAWEDIHDEVSSLLSGRTVAIYNAEFELFTIRQTAKIHNCTPPEFKAFCVMKLYADFLLEGWKKLRVAAEDLGVPKPPRGEPYRAAYDCLLCVGVLNAIAKLEG